jgi:hypothetical protein
MASDQFVAAVATEIERIVNSANECGRLGLAADLMRTWQGYVSQHSAAAMLEKVIAGARDNEIQLNNYEPLYARGRPR